MAWKERRNNGYESPPKVTVREVAQAAGVSMMTVSNVIHGRPNVGALARERVLKQIKKLGYVPIGPRRNLQVCPIPALACSTRTSVTPFLHRLLPAPLLRVALTGRHLDSACSTR